MDQPHQTYTLPDRTAFQRVLELTAIIGVILHLVMFSMAWSGLPDRVPTHGGFTGEWDHWGPKGSLLILPGTAIFLYVMLSLMDLLFKAAVRRVRSQAEFTGQLIGRNLIFWVKAEIVWLFFYIDWQAIRAAHGEASGLGPLFVPVVFAVIFGTIGWHIKRLVDASREGLKSPH